MYAELKILAEERSSEKRVELLRKITNVFLDDLGEHSEDEVSLFNDVVDSIVDQISREAKIDVSANLATLPGFPAPVIRKFAHDADIEIARPVLRNAIGLSERDLVEIARNASNAHLDAIAGRAQLSETVTDVLVFRGDREVMRTVSANHGAAFSEPGMERLIDRARGDHGLQSLLVERSDLSQKAIDQLCFIVSQVLIIKLAERGYQVSGNLPEHLAQTTSVAFARAVHERDRNAISMHRIITEFLAGRMTFESALPGVIKCGQMLGVAMLLGHQFRLECGVLMSVLCGGERQNAVVLMRAMELKWPAAAGILELRAKRQRQREKTGAAAEQEYGAIDVAVARRMLRFLQVRCNASGRPGSSAA